jgi:hypothetical protein
VVVHPLPELGEESGVVIATTVHRAHSRCRGLTSDPVRLLEEGNARAETSSLESCGDTPCARSNDHDIVFERGRVGVSVSVGISIGVAVTVTVGIGITVTIAIGVTVTVAIAVSVGVTIGHRDATTVDASLFV